MVEDARHAWNAARTLEAAEMQTQIEKMIAMAIGNAFCDTTLYWSETAYLNGDVT